MSVLFFLWTIGITAFANEDATSTLTVTESQTKNQPEVYTSFTEPEQIPQTNTENNIPHDPITPAQNAPEQAISENIDESQNSEVPQQETIMELTTNESEDANEEIIEISELEDADEELIEISETEAQMLMMTNSSEFEVERSYGRFYKRRHHHYGDCHTGITTTWSTWAIVSPINLWVQKTAMVGSTNTWSVGDTVVYKITYWNSWTWTATGVMLTDAFPLWFISTWWLVWWTATTGTLYTFNVGSVAPWQIASIIFTWTILIGTPWWVEIPNGVSISWTTSEDIATLSDNIAIATITAFWTGWCWCTAGWTWTITTWWVDVWVHKMSTVNGVYTWNVGDIVSYTIIFGNSGSVAATWVTLTDAFPLWFISTWWLSAWTHQTWTTLYIYNVWTLAPGATWHITFTWIALIGTASWVYVPNAVQILATNSETWWLLFDNLSLSAVTIFWSEWCGCGWWTTWLTTGSFFGRVYFDVDNNATRNSGELFAQWVTVLIKSITWLVLQTLTTDATGFYNGIIDAGTYVVQVLPLPWYVVTTLNNETITILWNTWNNLWEDWLYKQWGWSWWFGGGGYSGGFVNPENPKPTSENPKDLLEPIWPSAEQPLLPTELLSSWPENNGLVLTEYTDEMAAAIAKKTIVITQKATSYITTFTQKITLLSIGIKPIPYNNVIVWFYDSLHILEVALLRIVLMTMILFVTLSACHIYTRRI